MNQANPKTNSFTHSLQRILLFAIIFTVSSLSGGSAAYGQSCNCESNFAWVKKTFEENDAGFGFVLAQKGKDAYEAHNGTILARVKKAKTLTECEPILRDWLRFFRKGHISVNITDSMRQQLAKKTTGPASEVVAKHEKIPVNDQEFKNYIAGLKQPGYEGTWSSPPYKIGIRKKGNEYLGFIIEAPGTAWQKDQLKLKIYFVNGEPKSLVYMRDFSPQKDGMVDTLGNNYLNVGPLFMKRIEPVSEDPAEIKNYLEILNAPLPYIKKLSSNTVYLRIPSFDLSYKPYIDSLVTANNKLISSAPNFIIDLRGNGGGADAAYRPLIPYLYTNPIRTVDLEVLSTPLSNKVLLEYAKRTEFSEEQRQTLLDQYKKLSASPGKFVQVRNSMVGIDSLGSVLAYPENVGIIINEQVGSTAEQFLLAAKQSKKVKLFGTSTYGALDFSNMNFVPSPCNELELGYCRSRSFRIPGQMIDGVGIQPDYFMDKSIAPYKWVSFADDVLNKK